MSEFRQGGLAYLRRPGSWALWAQPRGEVRYLVGVELATVVAVAIVVAGGHVVVVTDWARFGLLLGLASVHMFLSRRQEESRRNRMDTVHVDLTSIWNFAAALVLPLPLALLCIVVIRFQRWFVARRPLYRFVFGTAVIAACVLGVHGVLMTAGVPTWSGDGVVDTLRDFGAAGAAGMVYVAGQILLVGTAIALHSDRPTMSMAVGSWYDNGLETFTVALGLVTAVLLVHAPPALLVMVVVGVLGNRLTEIRQLQVDVRTDPKTGLLNMRGWREAVAKELARADRARGVVGLLMIDLDHFKLINDTWGHPAGDDMLLAVADVLRAETRPADVVGRFGGEEFVVLLPDADTTAAVGVAERIRTRIAGLTVVSTDKRGGPAAISGRTTSVGVAVRRDAEGTLADLLQAADAAVYAAKEGGRDQVRMAGADGHDPDTSRGIAS
ncbi:MAG TPA: GGDEF domain-containing protein [Pseudonocardiaceae bacterium]|nr:GGDEF domain-containing protein [Pseudonocardiaceae bacterium]